jgi:hypothetical protein
MKPEAKARGNPMPDAMEETAFQGEKEALF